MQKRIIENWLINANELSFTIPFCQLLESLGHTIIFISKQSQMEQGKDVISIAPDKVICCYQLKAGNISKAVWRDIKDEVLEMVDTPPVHPSLPEFDTYRTYLVTNGELSDPVRHDLDGINRKHTKRGDPKIETIVKGQLVQDFENQYGSYLPDQLKDFSLFLKLYQEEGGASLPKADFSKLLESIFSDVFSAKKMSKNAIKQTINASVVILSYLLGNRYKEENYFAIYEAYSLLRAYILAAAEFRKLDQPIYMDSFKLTRLESNWAVEQLIEEVSEKKDYTDMSINPLTETLTYKPRVTALTGALGAYGVSKILEGDLPKETRQKIDEFLKETRPHITFEGEYLAPYLVNAIWYYHLTNQIEARDELLAHFIEAILLVNPTIGFPDPYHGFEEIMQKLVISKEGFDESFTGISYSLHSLLLLSAQFDQRELLKKHWRKISHVSLHEFAPKNSWDFLRWHSETGELKSRYPEATQSWKKLIEEAGKKRSGIPPKLVEAKQYIPHFLNVFPHRLTPDLVAFLSNSFPKPPKASKD